MKHLLYVVTERVGNAGRAIHSQVIEFDSLEEAKEARDIIMSKKTEFGDAVIISKTKPRLTKEDIFLELLKANPVASVDELWERSESAFKLISFQRI